MILNNLTEDCTTVATPEECNVVIDLIEDEMIRMKIKSLSFSIEEEISKLMEKEKERALMMDDAIKRELTKYIR